MTTATLAQKLAQMPELADYTLTTQEAAEILKMHVHHVRLLVRDKKIKAKKIGTMYLVSRASVEKYKKATEKEISSKIKGEWIST